MNQIIGVKVVQARCDSPEFQKHVGRIGTATEAFVDEVGNLHVKTEEDGLWCPFRLLDIC